MEMKENNFTMKNHEIKFLFVGVPFHFMSAKEQCQLISDPMVI